jgi:hypothetical protein
MKFIFISNDVIMKPALPSKSQTVFVTIFGHRRFKEPTVDEIVYLPWLRKRGCFGFFWGAPTLGWFTHGFSIITMP